MYSHGSGTEITLSAKGQMKRKLASTAEPMPFQTHSEPAPPPFCGSQRVQPFQPCIVLLSTGLIWWSLVRNPTRGREHLKMFMKISSQMGPRTLLKHWSRPISQKVFAHELTWFDRLDPHGKRALQQHVGKPTCCGKINAPRKKVQNQTHSFRFSQASFSSAQALLLLSLVWAALPDRTWKCLSSTEARWNGTTTPVFPLFLFYFEGHQNRTPSTPQSYSKIVNHLAQKV